MKQTQEDLQFADDFADALAPIVAAEKQKGRSSKRVAEDLGITEPALKKYLTGRTTPSVRTVALAFRKYGVSVPYSGVPLFGGPTKNTHRRQRTPNQLVLPFEIQAPVSGDRLAIKLLPTGTRTYQLQLKVRVGR